MHRITGWTAILLGVAVGAGVVWFRLAPERGRLREAVADAQSRNAAGSRMEKRREASADAVASAEAERLHEEREAIARLRSEIDTLKQRAEERARSRIAQAQAPRPAAPARERSIAEEMLPPEYWRNRGRATASAALETAMWAAAGGDVATLAEMLEFEPAARTKAAALLAGLPDTIRAQCSTPEQLVALLGANDVPLGEALISGSETGEESETVRRVQVSEGEGRIKRATIRLRREGDLWRLVVPERAIDRYAAILKASASR